MSGLKHKGRVQGAPEAKNGATASQTPYDVVVPHGSRHVRNPGSRGGKWYLTGNNRLRYGHKGQGDT